MSSLLDPVAPVSTIPVRRVNPTDTAFGCPRDFLDHHFVYLVVSPRAKGLSIGINMNPDQRCNFDCVYCEVQRSNPPVEKTLDIDVMVSELRTALELVNSGKVAERPAFKKIPRELLKLRQVSFSGDGEPTLAENFLEAVQAVVHIRAMGMVPLFKFVLVTNGTGLNREQVQEGIKFFNQADEIWIKLDAGTQTYADKINRGQVPLEQVLKNIQLIGKQRPVIIQSLFPLYNGAAPAWDEIESYSARLEQLKAEGTKISLVQIYSANRPAHTPLCDHLPLRTLSKIAQHVRQRTGLNVEVF
jgi:wyosine [tRNA(Phe)-imidazoG37] synthetase (radical SAM superfamily)